MTLNKRFSKNINLWNKAWPVDNYCSIIRKYINFKTFILITELSDEYSILMLEAGSLLVNPKKIIINNNSDPLHIIQNNILLNIPKDYIGDIKIEISNILRFKTGIISGIIKNSTGKSLTFSLFVNLFKSFFNKPTRYLTIENDKNAIILSRDITNIYEYTCDNISDYFINDTEKINLFLAKRFKFRKTSIFRVSDCNTILKFEDRYKLSDDKLKLINTTNPHLIEIRTIIDKCIKLSQIEEKKIFVKSSQQIFLSRKQLYNLKIIDDINYFYRPKFLGIYEDQILESDAIYYETIVNNNLIIYKLFIEKDFSINKLVNIINPEDNFILNDDILINMNKIFLNSEKLQFFITDIDLCTIIEQSDVLKFDDTIIKSKLIELNLNLSFENQSERIKLSKAKNIIKELYEKKDNFTNIYINKSSKLEHGIDAFLIDKSINYDKPIIYGLILDSSPWIFSVYKPQTIKDEDFVKICNLLVVDMNSILY
jgi:hypothetical protein